jgi:diaminohydroxyphosphoribosylaminopyrimidine deaminase / 5-amino-6-(5-phosphoribosylamino)uracil reductase
MLAEDRNFMLDALELARRGAGLASPNPTVGCVLARDGLVVGSGFHEYKLLDHAEVRAVREAAGRVRGATAYVTLEPCCHHGRTPPCTDLLIRSGVSRVVVAAPDPNPRVHGGGIDQLRASGIPVDVGILRRRAEMLIEPFACHVTTGRPLVVAKAGMTLDGRIGVRGHGQLPITSREAAEFTQNLRHDLDALLVGVGTVLEDDPELTYRGALPKGRGLIRVILDSLLRTPQTARLFADSSSPVVIYCAADAGAQRRRPLERRGAEVVPVPRTGGRLSLDHVLEDLGRRGILGLLVEGGSSVHWSFLSLGAVDKFYFILAPTLIGGRTSVPVVGGRGFSGLAATPQFKIARIRRVGRDVLLEAYPSSSRSIISPWPRSGVRPYSSQFSRLPSQPK